MTTAVTFPKRGTAGKKNGSPPHGSDPSVVSILLLTRFFATSFTCKRFLDSLLFAGLQVKGVALNLLNDVFLLHLALKSSQRVFEGLPLLESDFRQLTTPPNSSRWTR